MVVFDGMTLYAIKKFVYIYSMKNDKIEPSLIFCWMPILGLIHTWKCKSQLKPAFFYLGVIYGILSIIFSGVILICFV